MAESGSNRTGIIIGAVGAVVVVLLIAAVVLGNEEVGAEYGASVRVELTSLLLVPVGLLFVLCGLGGTLFAVGSVALACWMSWLSLRMLRERTRDNARRVFLASIAYLPLVLALLVLDQPERVYIIRLDPAVAAASAHPGSRFAAR